MIVTVHVGVALARPPKVDQWRRIIVEADTEMDGQLAACQIAACSCVMVLQADVVAVVL